MGKILDFGAQHLRLYKMNEALKTYAQAVVQEGLTTFEKTENQEAENKFADNKVHKTVLATKTIEGTITLLQVDLETKIQFLGKVHNENGSVTDGNSKSRLGAAYATKWLDEDDEERFRIKVLYDILFGAEEETDETTTEGITETTHGLPYTGKVSSFVKNDLGQYVSMLEFDCPKGTTEEDLTSIMQTIPMPTDPIVNFVDAEGTIDSVITQPGGFDVEVSVTLGDAIDATLEVYNTTELDSPVQAIEITESGTSTINVTGLTAGAYALMLRSSTSKLLAIQTAIAGDEVSFVEAVGTITIDSQDATSVTGSYTLTLNDATDGDVVLIVTDGITEAYNSPAIAGGASGTITGLSADTLYTASLKNQTTGTTIAEQEFTTATA